MDIISTLKDTFLGNLGEIFLGLITMVLTFFATIAKNKTDEYLKEKTKKEIVATAVKATEQMHHNLSGAEKLEKAMKAATDMLLEKDIKITELELLMLIEAAVCEFSDAFNKESWKDGLNEVTSAEVESEDAIEETLSESTEENTAEIYG